MVIFPICPWAMWLAMFEESSDARSNPEGCLFRVEHLFIWRENTSDSNTVAAIECFIKLHNEHATDKESISVELLDKIESLMEKKEQLDCIHKIMAGHVDCPRKILKKLAQSGDACIRLKIAENVQTDTEILAELAKDSESDIRSAVADNANTDIATLKELSLDENADVRYALAENANTPIGILSQLIMDDNPFVAMRASETVGKLSPPVIIQTVVQPVKQSTVVVVDDDPYVRALLIQKIDADPAFRVLSEAVNGLDALATITETMPDIVLMDIGLPEIDGVMVTKELKTKFPSLKILMVTGHEGEADIGNAIEAGADGYLLKQNLSECLLTALKNLATGNAWLDPGVASTVLRYCVRRKQAKVLPEKKPYGGPVQIIFDLAIQAVQEKRWDAAHVLCEAAFKVAEATIEDSPREILDFLTKLADCYYQKENYPSSESVYMKTLELRQRLFREADPRLDASLVCLAKLYESAGNLAQAELYYSWSLRLRERSGNAALISDAKKRLKSILKARQ